MSVVCTSCGQEWDMDPILQVKCPDCYAKPGHRCKRPSGYTIMYGGFHASRDRLAMKVVPGYGMCPKGPTALAAQRGQGVLL